MAFHEKIIAVGVTDDNGAYHVVLAVRHRLPAGQIPAKPVALAVIVGHKGADKTSRSHTATESALFNEHCICSVTSGTYCGANVADIKELMARYPDKKVILCAHWFDMKLESEEFLELLRNEERILCLFCGHNHRSHIVSTGEENGKRQDGAETLKTQDSNEVRHGAKYVRRNHKKNI